MNRCAMTGIEIRDPGDGIWDDGEWISWAYINPLTRDQLEEPVTREDLAFEPGADVSMLLIDAILEGPASLLWGRIGEFYAAERLGVRLSRPHAQGHDGHLGDELVEVKTITQGKRKAEVRVKTAGNFSVLVVVRVTENFELMIRWVRRDQLVAPPGAEFFNVTWEELNPAPFTRHARVPPVSAQRPHPCR
jgi:hypothetical protein